MPLEVSASDGERGVQYWHVKDRLKLLLEGETDWVATQATVRGAAALMEGAGLAGRRSPRTEVLTPATDCGRAARRLRVLPLDRLLQTRAHQRTRHRRLPRRCALAVAAAHAPQTPPQRTQAEPSGSLTPLLSLRLAGHGCLRISFDRGVCGACARTKSTQLVPDVHAFPGHIACSGTTKSEVVVPVLGDEGQLMAVFDVDSNHAAAFTQTDADELQSLFKELVSSRVFLTGTDSVGASLCL